MDHALHRTTIAEEYGLTGQSSSGSLQFIKEGANGEKEGEEEGEEGESEEKGEEGEGGGCIFWGF